MSDFNSFLSNFSVKYKKNLSNSIKELIENDSTDNLLLDIANLKCDINIKKELFECVVIDGDNKTLSRKEQIEKIKTKYGEDYLKSVNLNDVIEIFSDTIKNFDPSININLSISGSLGKFSGDISYKVSSEESEDGNIEINEETNPI